jgi:hypothetical protein
VDQSAVDAVVEELESNDRTLRRYVEGLDADRFDFTPVGSPPRSRTYIPVRSE